jgi:hypothetical protein
MPVMAKQTKDGSARARPAADRRSGSFKIEEPEEKLG